MKVLLSAYACEPGKGSEPGVGWHWAIEIARLGHEVHVITRANNAEGINAAIAAGQVPENLSFHYCDLSPRWIKITKRWLRSPYLYYYFWQRRATDLAKRLHVGHGFDMVHHITFASARLPSFMGELGIPFVFGPVGGGETTPWRLRRSYPLRGMVTDLVRDASNLWARLDPLMRKTYAEADKILLRSESNLRLIPSSYRAKVRFMVGIGVRLDELLPTSGASKASSGRVLFVGRLIYWKGLHLALRAFALARVDNPDLHLTVVGDGPEKRSFHALAETLGVDQSITWQERVALSDMSAIYRDNDLLLFPSLHDSAGMVVLEAAALGLPVVALDLGGPGTLVASGLGEVVSTQGLSEAAVIAALRKAVASQLRDHTLSNSQIGVVQAVRAHLWTQIVGELYPPAVVESDPNPRIGSE